MDTFSQSGTVESVKITDRETGRARGFGFVEMASVEEARCNQPFQRSDCEGRTLP